MGTKDLRRTDRKTLRPKRFSRLLTGPLYVTLYIRMLDYPRICLKEHRKVAFQMTEFGKMLRDQYGLTQENQQVYQAYELVAILHLSQHRQDGEWPGTAKMYSGAGCSQAS